MVQNIFEKACKGCKANFRGGNFVVGKSFAKLIGAITMMSAGGPLNANDLASGAEQPANTSSVRSAANNAMPVAVPDRVELKMSANAFNALANDIDADGDSLMMVTAIAGHGAVAFTPEGLLAYAQNPGPARPDKITYTVSDGRGGLATGLVEIVAR